MRHYTKFIHAWVVAVDCISPPDHRSAVIIFNHLWHLEKKKSLGCFIFKAIAEMSKIPKMYAALAWLVQQMEWYSCQRLDVVL